MDNKYKLSAKRANLRISQTATIFLLNNNTGQNLARAFQSGIKYLWLAIRFGIVGIFLMTTIVYYYTYIRVVPFGKIALQGILIVMLIYGLLSGFVFFLKKYQFSKFTSSIQRFGKRSYILFWLIEGGVFLCFFYLTINSSSEPIYMYDSIRTSKAQLFPGDGFY